jgi:hypothetical protein
MTDVEVIDYEDEIVSSGASGPDPAVTTAKGEGDKGTKRFSDIRSTGFRYVQNAPLSRAVLKLLQGLCADAQDDTRHE